METQTYANQGYAMHSTDADALTIGRIIWQKRRPILAATLAAMMISLGLVNVVTPKYKTEARLLIENRENIFTRPGGTGSSNDRQDVLLDQEAVRSNIQLILSRDLAREAASKLKLNENPDFDEVRKGIGPVKRILILLGLMKNPLNISPEERIFEKYYDALTVFSVDRSRVITIEFKSKDPNLSANAANTIAELFLDAQKATKYENSRQASQWLLSEIEQLRKLVAKSEAQVESFRAQSGLFTGTNSLSIASQQLSDLNQQVASGRSAAADAQARAEILRGLLKGGKTIEGSEVPNNELLRRLAEQRVNLKTSLALEGQTFLPQHPRMKELNAQITDLDIQIRAEVERAVRGLETESKVQEARVEALLSAFETQKKQVVSANESEVQLRALERESKANRDQLEAYLGRYREAVAREANEFLPPDARIISRAPVVAEPASPQKLPIIAVSTVGAFVLMVAGVVASAVLSGQSMLVQGAPMHPSYPAQAPQPAPQVAPGRVAAKREVEDVEIPLAKPAKRNATAPLKTAGAYMLKAEPAPVEPMVLQDEYLVEPSVQSLAVAEQAVAEIETYEAAPQSEAGFARLSRILGDTVAQESIVVEPVKTKATKNAYRIVVVGPNCQDEEGSVPERVAAQIAGGSKVLYVDLSEKAQASDVPGLLEAASGRIKLSSAIHHNDKLGCDMLVLGQGEDDLEMKSNHFTSTMKDLEKDYTAIVLYMDESILAKASKNWIRKNDLVIFVSTDTTSKEAQKSLVSLAQWDLGDFLMVSPQTVLSAFSDKLLARAASLA